MSMYLLALSDPLTGESHAEGLTRAMATMPQSEIVRAWLGESGPSDCAVVRGPSARRVAQALDDCGLGVDGMAELISPEEEAASEVALEERLPHRLPDSSLRDMHVELARETPLGPHADYAPGRKVWCDRCTRAHDPPPH